LNAQARRTVHPLIQQLLAQAPVVTDGAWGTELQARGLSTGEFPDAWNLTRPDAVAEVARAYVEAGSRVILTNTFGANSIRLGADAAAGKALEINRRGVEISRQAAAGRARVFASIGPTGKLLLTIGKEGVAGGGPDTFDQPSGIAIAPNGYIFVTDGHGKNDRVVKFSPDGRFVKTWGHHGAGPGEFDQPHDISIGGSEGHVFVADRSNSRVQIFDQDGNFIAAWKQFGRPSAVFVSKDDTLYVSDSQSNSTVNPGYPRGITVGSAKDGSLRAFIPDPDLAQADVNRISGASGIVADDKGTIYAADVGPHRLRKYVLK